MKLIPTLALTALFTAAIGSASIAQVAATPPAAGRASAAARAAAAADRAAARGAAAANRAAAAREAAATRIDQRQANQQRRIAAGIKHGQLTPDEVAKLQALETNIQTLETSLKSDAKLTKPELQQVRQALNEASLQIWAQRHDTEGKQMPALRLGKDVFAQDQLTAQIESDAMTRPQARAFLQDFRQLVTLKHRLAAETLTADERARLQTQYDTLLNKYFTLKP